jgi:putative hemolysin
MKTKHDWKIFIVLTLLILLTSCSAPSTLPAIVPVPTNTPQANMPNPASVYCEQQGNRLEILTAADGSQAGVCIFPDGSECDEWAYFRGECKPTPAITGSVGVPTQTVHPTKSVIPQSVPLPAGAIIDPRGDTAELTRSMIFYNTDGLTLGELLTPLGGYVQAAGPYQGTLAFPLVFQSYEPGGQKQFIDLNSGSTPAGPGGQVSHLVSLEDKAMLSGLVGVPGEPVIFYILFQPVDAVLRSQFVFGEAHLIAETKPVLTLESTESQYWTPVAIQIEDNAPSGLWFTRTLWGIGGGYFPHNEGLSLLDLSSETVMEVLPPEARFNSLSVDQTWAAYSLRSESGSEFYIRNLSGGDPLILPALPESDSGAGYGLFSPSNKYIAWVEMQGDPFAENFQQMLRVATLDGQSIGDFPDGSFYKAAELVGAGLGVKPAAWLDDENLLVQVTAAEKSHDGTVVKLNLTTGEYSLFARGYFAGLFYP